MEEKAYFLCGAVCCCAGGTGFEGTRSGKHREICAETSLWDLSSGPCCGGKWAGATGFIGELWLSHRFYDHRAGDELSVFRWQAESQAHALPVWQCHYFRRSSRLSGEMHGALESGCKFFDAILQQLSRLVFRYTATCDKNSRCRSEHRTYFDVWWRQEDKKRTFYGCHPGDPGRNGNGRFEGVYFESFSGVPEGFGHGQHQAMRVSALLRPAGKCAGKCAVSYQRKCVSGK